MAPVIAAALPAIIGTVIRALGTAAGTAAVVTAPPLGAGVPSDDLQAAIGGAVTALCVLWGIVQKIRAEKEK